MSPSPSAQLSQLTQASVAVRAPLRIWSPADRRVICQSILTRLARQRFVFTVTTGRSGTGFVAELLSVLPDVCACHEPPPSYEESLRLAQTTPGEADRFLVEQKLPVLAYTQTKPVYVEASHMCCKGFLQAWLARPELPTPDLILLDRRPRQVALSLARVGTVPGRTTLGLEFCLSPDDPTCLTQLPGWEALNDYQLCYWYCCEIEKRKQHLSQLVRERDGRVVRTSVEQLGTSEGFKQFCAGLALDCSGWSTWLAYLRKRRLRVNAKKNRRVSVPPDSARLASLEAEVHELMEGSLPC